MSGLRCGDCRDIHVSRADTIVPLIMLHNERILGMSFPQEKPNTEAPKEFENVSLLLWQGLPLTTNPWEKKRRFSNRRNLKTMALRFSVDGKNFENGSFRKRRLCDFLTRAFLSQIQM